MVDEENVKSDGAAEVAPLISQESKSELKPYQKLITSKRAYSMSLWAMRVGVLADSINSTILRPSYPFMVLPESDPEAFPNTDPFGFSSAQYFLPMTSLLGTAIAATFVGSLSDRIGRRPVMLVCVGFGVIGSIAKYVLRESFWGFCAANFVTGLFGATLTVSMAYASDVAHTRAEKDAVIGSLVGISMVGATGGGIIAIAMGSIGLFSPLLVGAALNFVAAGFSYYYLVEPNRMLHVGTSQLDDDDEEDEVGPEKLDARLTTNILLGALLDNAGSTGLVPFCLSPLAFNTFLVDFLESGQEPLMNENAYRWIATMLAIMIIPAAASSNALYNWIGAAGGCVAGNFLTAIMTIILLQIALVSPATNVTYAFFVAMLYIGFPFTVISQLSTGPMLDMISPHNSRGFTQGLNTTVMNFGSAVSPWVFGIIADRIGTVTTIWICVGVSFLATFVNAPLLFAKKLKRKKHVPDYSRHLKGEDKDLIEQALRGEWVPAAALHQINMERMENGRHFLQLPVLPYEDDRENLKSIKKHAKEDFTFHRTTITGWLGSELMSSPDKRAHLVEQVEHSRLALSEREEVETRLGQWFAAYLHDAGYRVDESPIMYKQMIMSAFPVILKEDGLTAENLEQATLNYSRIVNHYLEEVEEPAHIKAFARAYV